MGYRVQRSQRARSGAHEHNTESAATDRNDDLESIAVDQPDPGMLGFGHNFTVTFYRKALASEAALLEQGEHGNVCGEGFGLAVEDDLDHGDARHGYGRKS
jgi:hypothetical protein